MFLTFTLYIRLMMEAFLFMAISTVSELHHFDTSSSVTIGSLVFGFIFALLLVAFVSLIMFEIIRAHPELNSTRQWMFTELFNGIKNSTEARLYPLLLVLSHVLCVFIVIVFHYFSLQLKIGLFSLVQILFCAYLIKSRPFDERRDNISQIINQVLYCILCLSLFHLKDREDWGEVIESIFIICLLSGPFFCSFLTLFAAIKLLFTKLKA